MDADTRLIHSVAITSARVHDSQVIGALLHGKERGVWGDSAYQGRAKRSGKRRPRPACSSTREARAIAP